MAEHHVRSVTLTLLLWLCVFGRDAFGSESETDLPDSKPRNIARIIKPPDVSKKDLRKIKRTAVLITSTSELFGQVAEDLLAAKLRDANFEVVERTKVSEVTVEELNRIRKQAEADKETQQDVILNVIKIAQKLGLDAVIAGTLFEGRRQTTFPEDKPPRFMDKIVVSTFYLQVIDARTEKVVLSVILEYDKGETVVNAVDVICRIIKEEAGS